jgi:hypothetical protein
MLGVNGPSVAAEAHRRVAAGPWLTKGAMQWFSDAYLPECSQASR